MNLRLTIVTLTPLLGLLFFGCQQSTQTLAEKVADRDFPSVFQAWNPLDTPEYPQDTNEGRLLAAAKHDFLWEEPVSMLGFGTDLVLGAVWDHEHGGLASQFTSESQSIALKNREDMLAMNPNMIFLLEVRWRDAPGSFLPVDSPYWQRNEDGTRVLGWDNGPEPYYMLDQDSEAFHENIARQSAIALASGVYDGIMLDWNGYLPIVKKVREAIGSEGLLIVNIHDEIEPAEEYKAYINGSFMELNPAGPGCVSGSNLRTWENIEKGLKFFESEFLEPQVNCLEVWGDRSDLRRMRATTTLGLTISDGYVLYADPNPLPSPDHLHDWYDFWDVELGQPLEKGTDREDGGIQREFEGGVVIHNRFENNVIKVSFDKPMISVATGKSSTEFELQDADGDIYLPSE